MIHPIFTYVLTTAKKLSFSPAVSRGWCGLLCLIVASFYNALCSNKSMRLLLPVTFSLPALCVSNFSSICMNYGHPIAGGKIQAKFANFEKAANSWQTSKVMRDDTSWNYCEMNTHFDVSLINHLWPRIRGCQRLLRMLLRSPLFFIAADDTMKNVVHFNSEWYPFSPLAQLKGVEKRCVTKCPMWDRFYKWRH